MFILLFASTIIVSCNNKRNNNTRVEQDRTAQAANDRRTSTHHEGTYQGVYRGDLPSASGSGMMVTINLTGDRYVKTIVYNEDATREEYKTEGHYTWNDAHNIITLEGEEKPNSYMVGNNELYHLDVDGNRITGELADQYILRKQ